MKQRPEENFFSKKAHTERERVSFWSCNVLSFLTLLLISLILDQILKKKQ